MEEPSVFQKGLLLLSVCLGLGVVVLFFRFVKKDRRSPSEKFLDKAKDLGSQIPGVK